MTPHISVSLLGTQSDERLASLAGSGHERAFEAIVERYSKALTRYAQRFLGEARADEVVQAAFLSAWSALTTGTEVRDLRPWLYRIVHNGALNAMNRSESGDLELIEATDGALSPHAILEQNEEVRSALNVIAELPERQRAALLAVAVDGRAHADVAADLGVSDAGVRQLVRRARVQLRTAVTALTPLPLALWLADGQRGPSPDVSHRIAEILADGGGNALAASAMKAGAIVVSVAAVATAAPKVSKVIEKGDKSEAAGAIIRASAAGAGALGGGPAAALIPGLSLGASGPSGGNGRSVAGFDAGPGAVNEAGQPVGFDLVGQAPAGGQYGQERSSVFAPLPDTRQPGGGRGDNPGRGGDNPGRDGDNGSRSQPFPPATTTPSPSNPGDSDSGGGKGDDTPSTPSKPDNSGPGGGKGEDRPSTPSKPDNSGPGGGKGEERPSTPSSPEKPSKPDNPSKPDKPSKPEKPSSPDKPSKPDSSGDDKPSSPSRPGDGKSDQKPRNPKPSDD